MEEEDMEEEDREEEDREGEIGRETKLYSGFTDYNFSLEGMQNFVKKSKNRAERNDTR
jgi:hypothetical protein